MLSGKINGVGPALMHVLEGSLPLVAEYADTTMIPYLINVPFWNTNRRLHFEKQDIITALRRANEREDNYMPMEIFSLLVRKNFQISVQTCEVIFGT